MLKDDDTSCIFGFTRMQRPFVRCLVSLEGNQGTRAGQIMTVYKTVDVQIALIIHWYCIRAHHNLTMQERSLQSKTTSQLH